MHEEDEDGHDDEEEPVCVLLQYGQPRLHLRQAAAGRDIVAEGQSHPPASIRGHRYQPAKLLSCSFVVKQSSICECVPKEYILVRERTAPPCIFQILALSPPKPLDRMAKTDSRISYF